MSNFRAPNARRGAEMRSAPKSFQAVELVCLFLGPPVVIEWREAPVTLRLCGAYRQ